MSVISYISYTKAFTTHVLNITLNQGKDKSLMQLSSVFTNNRRTTLTQSAILLYFFQYHMQNPTFNSQSNTVKWCDKTNRGLIKLRKSDEMQDLGFKILFLVLSKNYLKTRNKRKSSFAGANMTFSCTLKPYGCICVF